MVVDQELGDVAGVPVHTAESPQFGVCFQENYKLDGEEEKVTQLVASWEACS